MSKQGPQGHQEQVRMTAKEYRIMMGLDPEEGKAKIVVQEGEDDRPTLSNQFNSKASRIVLRMLWLAGWAWMIFTFGWVGHIAAVLARKGLRE